MFRFKENHKLIKKTLLLFFILTFSFLVALSFILLGADYLVSSSVKKEIVSREEKSAVVLNRATSDIINLVKSDVLFLTRQIELFYLREKSDFNCHLEETFYQFSLSKKMYDQVRFIDVSGMEKARINLEGENVLIVPENKLQNKSDRYYFKEIIKFRKDSVYFSVLDLNVEDDQIETPYKPMIRVGSPVFDSDRNVIGIVIVNFLGNIILDEIKLESKRTDANTLFLNKNGYYFIGLNPEDEWGFMFEDKKGKTFFNDFVEESKIIYGEESGTLSTEKGLFVFSTIAPQFNDSKAANLSAVPENIRLWKIVSYIPQKQIDEAVSAILFPWIQIAFLFSAIIIFLFWLLARSIQFKRQADVELLLKNIELSETNATKDKFFSIIAHDLRSPFQGILSVGELLSEHIDELEKEEIEEMAMMMYKTSKNTYELLENLLDWSRIQTGKLKPYPTEIELKNSLMSLKLLMDSQAQRKDIQLQINAETDAHVFADQQMLNAVLRNLVSNAIKFTPRGGTVNVCCEVKTDFAEIAVSDTGIGIDNEVIGNLFKIDKVKSQNGTENEPGTGLGLLLCKEFMDKNNGSIRVSSKIGQGSTFFISLPLVTL